MSPMTKPNDHKRIALRLLSRIAGAQIVAFIIIDILLLFLVTLSSLDPAAIEASSYFDENMARLVENIQSIPYLDIGLYWGLLSVVALEVILILTQTSKLRKDIRDLLEPLRELRVAADAFSAEGGVSADALRRVSDALSHVEAGDMNAHIPAESLSPELRPLIEAITEMLDRLEAAYAAQAKFVSDASHELRTPIAVIQGYANLLSRWGSEDPETLRESIEAIRTEAESMKRMVNQLLFLARGDNDTLRLEIQRVDLVPIADEVLNEARMVEEEADGKEGAVQRGRHEIEACFPEGGVFVSADPALIKQLIRILVDNSIKYTPADGGIKLSVFADQTTDRAFVSVQDEGRGISAELLPHIFDRFVRADEARTRNSGGLGLGLSIAKQITERHGGTLEVFSIEGAGSRFTIILPLL